jgi:hypothetical protein
VNSIVAVIIIGYKDKKSAKIHAPLSEKSGTNDISLGRTGPEIIKTCRHDEKQLDYSAAPPKILKQEQIGNKTVTLSMHIC